MSSEANIDFTVVRREVDQTVSAIERLERAVAKTNKSNLDKLQESLAAIGKSGNRDVQALVKDMGLAVNTVRGMLTKQNSNLQKSMKELGQGILVSMRESLVNAAKLSKDHAMQVEANNSRLVRAIDKSTYDMQAAYRRQVAAATNAAKVAGNPFTRYSPLTGESGALVENASALARMQAKADKEVLTDRLANIRQFQSAVQGILKQSVADQKQTATEALSAARAQAKADKDILDTRLANIRQYKSAVQGILKQSAEQTKLSSLAVNIGNTGARLGGAEIAGQYSAYNAMLAKPVSPVKPTDAANVDKLSNSFRKLTIEGNDAHSMARGLASGFNLLWLTWGNLVPLFSGAAISFGLKKTFDVGSEVEYLIRFMETLGQTTDEAGNQMKYASGIIREELRAIDQTSMFTLTDLTKGMVNLGQAGKSVPEAFDILRASADLAAVGMTDLKTATDLMIQTQALFGLSTKDSAKTASQIFTITKSGVLNVENIGASMKYASEANTRFGKSLEETLVVLGALAQAGLKDNSGGTALINFYRDINGRSGPAVAAMKELEKRTGKSIEVFDKLGKQRSGIDIFKDIADAADTLKAKDADRILAKIFSDRGGRAFFAMVREGFDKLKADVKDLENVDPNAVFKGAQGLMDTVKGASNILQGTLTKVFDSVFERYSDNFKDFIVTLTQAIDSDAFRSGLDSIVSGAMSAFSFVKRFSDELQLLFGVWLSTKAFSFASSAFTAIATGLALLVPKVNMTVGAFAAQALSTDAATAATVRAAASQASMGTMLAATSARATLAAGSMRLLASAAAFLANPLVGLAVTAATVGAAWWQMSQDGEKGSDALAGAVDSSGKVILKSLDDQIAKARERNSLLNIDPATSGLQARLDALKEKNEADKRVYEALRRTNQGAAQEAFDVVTSNLQGIAALEAGIAKMGSDRKAREDAEEKKRQDKIEKERLRAKKEAEAQGLTDSGAGNSRFARDAQRFTEQYAKDSLSAISSAADQRLQVLDQSYNRERQLMEAQYSAGMLAEGQYQANLLMLLKGSEQKRLEELAKAQTATQAEADSTVASWNATFQNKVASFKGSEAELSDFITNEWRTLDDKFENLQAKRESDTARWAKARADIEGEAAQRMKLSTINAYKEVSKLEKDTAEAARTKGLEEQKAERLEAVADAYSIVTDKTTAFSQAEKAAAIASVQASAEVEATLSKFDALIAAQTTAIKAFQTAAKTSGMEADKEVLATIASMEGAITRLKTLRGDVVTAGADSVASSASKAFDKVIKDDVQRLKASTADAIETALFEGGQQGRRKLRDLIVAELRKPITLTVNALVNAGFNAVGLGGTGSAGSNASGLFSAGASLIGRGFGAVGGSLAASNAVGALGGDALGSFIGANAANWGVSAAGTAMSNIMSVAFDPVTLGIGALVSVLASLDDSGTFHTGGLGSYSAALGQSTGMSVKGQGLAFGVDAKDFSTSGEEAAVKMAQSIVTMLDSTAAAFGKQAGYFAATAFADDTSKDGAWGALQIKLGNQMLMNWADNPAADANVPRIFADGEAGAKQYASEVAGSVKSVIDGMGLPEWAQEIADRVAGANPTVESLSAALQQIAATPEQVLQTIGTSGEALATILLDGMRNSDPAGAGQAFADQITFGIENSLYSGFASQVTNLVSTHLVTPVVTAMMAGSTLTEAMAKTSIDTMLSQVRAAANAMKAVLDDPGIQAALAEINTIVASTVTGAITGLTAPAAPAAYERVTASTDSVAEATEKLAQDYDSLADSLKSTTESLQDQLMEAQGDAAGVLSAQRSRFIDSIRQYAEVQQTALLSQYDYNQSLRDQIDLLTSLSGVTDSLKSTTDDLKDQLMEAQGNTTGVLEAQRNRFIDSIKKYTEVQQTALLSQYDYNQSLRDQIDLIAKQKTVFESLRSIVDQAYQNVDRFQSAEDARTSKLIALAWKAEQAFGGSGDDWFAKFSAADEQTIKDAISSFVALTGPSNEAKSAALEIGNALLDLADASKQAQKAVADQVESLMDYVRELQTGRAGLATPAELVQSTRVNYLSDLAAARGGDADSISSVKTSAQAYIDAMKGYSASSGLTQAVIDQVISELSGLAGLIPGFATGGNHAGGWMEVGERGRELVYTPPSHVFSAAQSATMVNGSADAAEEVRQLRREMALMREQMAEQTAAVIQHNYAANSAAASTVSNSVTSAVARNDLNAATLPALQ